MTASEWKYFRELSGYNKQELLESSKGSPRFASGTGIHDK